MACENRAIVCELSEKMLDQMTGFIKIFVVNSWIRVLLFGWDPNRTAIFFRGFAALFHLNSFIRSLGFIGEHPISLPEAIHQRIGAFQIQITDFTFCQVQSHWVSKRIPG